MQKRLSGNLHVTCCFLSHACVPKMNNRYCRLFIYLSCLQMNAETYFITLREIQEKIAPVLNPGDIQFCQVKEEMSDVMARHESQHESRWGDKVDQQNEKNVEIKSETEKECN